MDFKKYKIKNSTKCNCGREFTIMDAKEIVKNNDYHYYGGRVEQYSVVKCPKCGREHVLFIEAVNNGYRVFDIAEGAKTIKNAPKEKQDALVRTTQEDKSNEQVETQVEGNTTICKKCGRTFKSVSGLRSHERKCL